jgi:hypothetical protein
MFELHSLKIDWKDQPPLDGGGMRLTVMVDGRTVHDQAHCDVEEARTIALSHLSQVTFANQRSALRPNV